MLQMIRKIFEKKEDRAKSSIESQVQSVLSRSGSTRPGGKLIYRFDIPVDETLHDAITALCTINRVPKAEFLRLLIEEVVFGKLYLLQRVSQSSSLNQSDESTDERPDL